MKQRGQIKVTVKHGYKCTCGGFESSCHFYYCPMCGRKQLFIRRLDTFSRIGLFLFMVGLIIHGYMT